MIATVTRAVPVTSLARPGRPCLDALVSALSQVRGGDPLTPATVIVPGPLSALHVRRALGRLGGTAAVDVVPTARLADRLAGPSLAAAGTRPLPPGGWEEAVRLALAADPGPFRAVAHHPATVSRVASALRRLRPATTAERGALAGSSGAGSRARHLVRLLGAVEEATPRHHDRFRVLAAACAAVRSGADPGPVVSFCPPGTDPAEVDLLATLAATGRLRVVAAVTGAPSADEPLLAMVGRLDGPGAWAGEAGRSGEPPVPAQLMLAPDAEAEARLVVQHVVHALEAGVPGHRIGVVTLGGAAGLGRLSDLFVAAGVPWSGPAGRSLAATPAGRALLALLGLAAEGWSHAGVLAALAAAPLRRSPSRPGPLPLGRWAALARRANVVRGPDQWRDRVGAAADRAQRAGDLAAAAELADLAGFTTELGDLLTPPPEAGWAALARWAVAVLDHVLDPSPAAGWPDAEVAATRSVRSTAAGLEALDDLVHGAVGAPTPADLVAALEARLSSMPAPRHGRVGHGVLLAADPLDLVGATPNLLLLAGVVEGAAPARRAADPLVTDAELQLVGGASSRAVRRAGATAATLAAVAAADRTVAFAHRSDAQVARRPSRWFLGWAAALAGVATPLGADELEHLSASWLTVVPSFAATTCGAVAGSVQERRVAALAQAARGGRAAADLVTSPIVLGHPALRRSMIGALARRSDRFTEWDGLVAPGLALDEEVSSTALEDWAACPQRYLLRHVLSVAATEAPGDPLDVDARDRGTLAHEVLAAVVRRGLERPPTAPWDDDDRAFLRAFLRRRAEEWRREGRLGGGVLAELRIDELQAGLLAALDLDDANRADEGWVPQDVELGFGERHGRPVTVTLPSGRTVRLSGRVDRLDATAEQVRVVDYKTGSGKRYLDPAAGGAAAARLLQLGVYEAAARSVRPEGKVISGWWLVDVVGRDGRPLPIQPNRLRPEGFTEALDAIASGVEGGAFPADPGEDGYRGPETCRFCPYDRVCRVDRVRALRRKSGDPALEPWRALRAVGESVAAGEDRT